MRSLIAIPVYNEARYLPRVIEAVRRHGHDILIVDDGSTDRTAALLQRESDLCILRHEQNLGYGRSLIDALQFADRRGYDWIITLDCDEQHEPAWIPRFIEAAERDDADVISGSRYLTDLPGNTNAPSDRRRINEVVTAMLNGVLDLSLTDSFCGFKAHRVASMRRLKLAIDGYAFPLQFWVQAAHAGLGIREISVPLIYNDPNRHFGGVLDDPDTRLQHYLDVLSEALTQVGRAPLPDASPCGDPTGCPTAV
ncbi:MAG: glycosyltransferase family 2 protein [Phycisphaerae bacterium]